MSSGNPAGYFAETQLVVFTQQPFGVDHAILCVKDIHQFLHVLTDQVSLAGQVVSFRHKVGVPEFDVFGDVEKADFASVDER